MLGLLRGDDRSKVLLKIHGGRMVLAPVAESDRVVDRLWEDLRGRGFILRDGLTLGGDYVLYRGG